MCGFIVWVAVTAGAWFGYFNARSDPANNPGGETVWLWIAIVLTILFVVPLMLSISKQSADLRAEKQAMRTALARQAATEILERRHIKDGDGFGATFDLKRTPDGRTEWAWRFDDDTPPSLSAQDWAMEVVSRLEEDHQ